MEKARSEHDDEIPGSTNYSFYVPRKALTLLKERYGEGNRSAVMRGLVADELGDEWPEEECFKSNRFVYSNKILKVLRPSEYEPADEDEEAEE